MIQSLTSPRNVWHIPIMVQGYTCSYTIPLHPWPLGICFTLNGSWWNLGCIYASATVFAKFYQQTEICGKFPRCPWSLLVNKKALSVGAKFHNSLWLHSLSNLQESLSVSIELTVEKPANVHVTNISSSANIYNKTYYTKASKFVWNAV